MKLNLGGSLAHLEARLVAKCYSYMYGVDYENTFSHVTNVKFVCLIVLVVTYQLPLSIALVHHKEYFCS